MRSSTKFVLWESTASALFRLLDPIENVMSNETFGTAWRTQLENPQKVMKGEQGGVGKSEEGKWKDSVLRRAEQNG